MSQVPVVEVGVVFVASTVALGVVVEVESVVVHVANAPLIHADWPTKAAMEDRVRRSTLR